MINEFDDPRGSLCEISDEMLDEVSDLVLRGCTLEDIISLFKLSSDWMSDLATRAMETSVDVAWDDIDDDLRRYIVFMSAYTTALRDMKSELFDRVYAGKSNYASAAWLLARKFPEEYGFGSGASVDYTGSNAVPTRGDRELDNLASEAESSGEIQLNADAVKSYEEKINAI